MGNFKETPFNELTFGIIGLGLIGGSYARALRELGVRRILGMDRSRGIANACRSAHLVDELIGQDGSGMEEADVVICCIYPGDLYGFLEERKGHLRPGALVTDVSGIKDDMPRKIQAMLPAGVEFISGHPMAGRQGSGLGMSDASIFDGANYIIVPTEENSSEAIVWMTEFAERLGCGNTVQISGEEHDRIIAYTSNLPHLLAVSLLNSRSFDESTKQFIAGSFRDATRVADINPELWKDLFLGNRENVLQEIDNFREQLDCWEKLLRDNDGEGLTKIMEEAAEKSRRLY